MPRFSLAPLIALMWSAPVGEGATSGRSDWQRLRTEYPYHIQVIAPRASEPEGRTLVITEPSPSGMPAELQRSWPREFGVATIERHPIGAVPRGKKVRSIEVHERKDIFFVRNTATEADHAPE
jgi:hypothetical protein